MPRTFIRQDDQILSSSFYDDTRAAGITLQTNASSSEDDFNALRSQVKRIIGGSNWYSALTSRSLGTVDTDLSDLEGHRILFRKQIFNDIVVSGAFHILSVTHSGEAPSEVAAVGASFTTGAVAASASIGFFSLNLVTGLNALRPKNLVLIRTASSGETLQTSGGWDIYGLLQTEATDGNFFDDTTNQVQISFVRENDTRTALTGVLTADVSGAVINYAYPVRTTLDDMPEDAHLAGVFIDEVFSSGSVATLDSVIDAQGTTPATQATNIFIRLNDEVGWKFQDSTGARTLWQVTASALAGGDAILVDVDNYYVTSSNPARFSAGMQVATSSQQINVGTTAGQIDTAGQLTLRTTAGGDLFLSSSSNVRFLDSYKTGSGFASGYYLSTASAHWNNVETAFGEVSLLEMLYRSWQIGSGSVDYDPKCVAEVTGTAISANTNVSAGVNVSGTLCNYSGTNFVTDVDVYLNGVLQRNGADSSANHDVYPGTSPTLGDLKFEFSLKKNDQITVRVLRDGVLNR